MVAPVSVTKSCSWETTVSQPTNLMAGGSVETCTFLVGTCFVRMCISYTMRSISIMLHKMGLLRVM